MEEVDEAVDQVSTKVKMKIDWSAIIARIIVFIPIVFILFTGCMFIWLKLIKNFIIYGGEANVYNKVTNRKTIQDVFDTLMNKQKEENGDYCSPPNITYCQQAIHPDYDCEKEGCKWINRYCFECINSDKPLRKENNPCDGKRGNNGPCINYFPNK